MTVEGMAGSYEEVKGSGCWEWKRGARVRVMGGKEYPAYGNVWWRGKIRKAHRVMWEIHRGDIPEGKMVLHRCDNPRCVNPAHLFLGSAKENQQDSVEKGRHSALRKAYMKSIASKGGKAGRGSAKARPSAVMRRAAMKSVAIRSAQHGVVQCARAMLVWWRTGNRLEAWSEADRMAEAVRKLDEVLAS